MSDINDNAGYEYTNEWNTMMEKVGLRNIIQTKYGNRPLLRTYDKGKRCLDLITVSENIKNDDIAKSGIIPFYSLSASDHRSLYIDIRVDALFDDINPDPTNHTHRRFTTKNVYKCKIYIENLSNFFQEARLVEKVKQIKADIDKLLSDLG